MRSGKALLVLAVVFVAMVALYKYDVVKPKDDTEQHAKVFTVDAAKLEELTVKSTSGETTTLKKEKAGWQLVQPVSATADESMVSGITSSLSTLENNGAVDEAPKDLGQYGLSQPRISVTFKSQGDKAAHTLLLGNKTPTGGDMYAQRGGEKAVFVVPAYVEATFDKKTFDLRDKTVLKFDRDTASRLEIVHGDTKSAFVKNGMDWAVAEPIKARADFSVIEGIVSRLQSAQMTSLVSDNATDLKPYGLDNPSATVTVGAGSARATLLIGSAATGDGKTGVYGKDASRPLVFTLPQDLVDELKKNVDELRKKDVFEFRPFNTTRIEFIRGGQTTVFEKTKGTGKDATEKWRRVAPAARDVDAAKMEAVLTKFSNLRAQSFADAKTPNGLGSPVLTIKAVFDELHRNEQASFGKVGSDVFAGRPDEPGAMKLTATEFDDAMKALDELK
jgi:hypothetical protein